jgi:hypothetical protein
LNRLLNEIRCIKACGNNGNMRGFHHRCFLAWNILKEISIIESLLSSRFEIASKIALYHAITAKMIG